jgi:antitoxin component YwqK of YwqJK toxin-antitoxin module
MKWYFYLLMMLAIACKGKVTVTEDEIGADVFYSQGSYKPYSGKCVVVFNNTTVVKEQFTFRNGKLHGESLAWYKNGQMRRKGYYYKGQISGKWEFWNEAGNKTTEAHYKKDVLNGSYIALYTNGRIKEKGQFSENKRIGEWSLYDQDGRLIRTCSR